MNKDFNNELPNIADWLRVIQNELQISNKEMATALGVSEAHYKYKLLRGTQPIGMDQLFLLFDQFNISIDYLFSGQSTNNNKKDSQVSCIEKLNEISFILQEVGIDVKRLIDKQDDN